MRSTQRSSIDQLLRDAARPGGQRGGASWVTYLLIIVVVGGGYLLVTYSPYYLDHYKAKTKCEKVLNETWRFKDESKTALRLRTALEKVARVEVFEHGEMKKVPAINPDERDLHVEIDTTVTPEVLRAEVDYVRIIEFPFLKKTKEKWFNLKCELSLEEVIW